LSLLSLYGTLIIDVLVFLYIQDSKQETSKIIIYQSFIEIGIDIWKILKTQKLSLSTVFPFISISSDTSYESSTKEYDKYITKLLIKLLAPLYIMYLTYSLLWESHNGWYSYFLYSSVGFTYLFGFIQMTP
jgi:hypothetical protein